MKWKKWAVLPALAMAAVLAAGCAKTATNTNVKTIKVGTMGTYSPFTYLDENENLTGYDIEVLRLLDEKIPSIQFEFIQAPWEALFAGLDSDKFDLLANQISWSPERDEKYLFTDKGYIYVQTKLCVRSDDNTHTSLADFKGEVLGGITGDAFTEIMEKYNEEHGNPFTIQYYGAEYVDIFMDIDAGRVAGTVNDTIVVPDQAKSLGLHIKSVGDVLEASPSYYVFRKDSGGEDLKSLVDKAMSEAIEDGSLSALCIKWFGEDYTKE
jgi:L-cystine transport system substrate-binding protein